MGDRMDPGLVTNQNYTMTCLREGDAVICRGGNDAAVFFLY